MLELNWTGKHVTADAVPHVLVEDAVHSCLADESAVAGSICNRLIFGDSLAAMQTLSPDLAGRVKCIFMDPPYNTGGKFEHYRDDQEHAQWLSFMRDRLVLAWGMLAPEGSLWMTIDDNEGHYLKLLCDEIFGRDNFMSDVAWQKKYGVSNNHRGIASLTDRILVYRKSPLFRINLFPRSAESDARYSNPDNDPRGPWKAVDYFGHESPAKRPHLVYGIQNPFTGEILYNTTKAWKFEPETHARHVAENRVWWGLRGQNSRPALKRFLYEVHPGMVPHNWWPHTEVGHTDEAKKESIFMFGPSMAFATPKPERLLHRILSLATDPGDMVLDIFAGSGTTGAVAHKMCRRWIMVELGEQCHTHVIPRMQKVVAGEDDGGVTALVGWTGGGGYRYFRLENSASAHGAV